MAITLADAAVNAQDMLETAVIDDLRTDAQSGWFMDQMTFLDTVSPGGGQTLTANYVRLTETPVATIREIGQEGVASQAKRVRKSVDLKIFNGKFEEDRVIAHLGNPDTDEQAFQFAQANKSLRARFCQESFYGDTDENPNGFDGLDKALAGTITEFNANVVSDWTAATLATREGALAALDALDELINSVDGGADALVGNEKSMARIRSIARAAGYHSQDRDDFGRMVTRFNETALIDLGHLRGGPANAAYLIPVEARNLAGDDPDGGLIAGLTDIFAVKFDTGAFCGYSVAGAPLVKVYEPDWTRPTAVQPGEVEMVAAAALKSTRGAGVLRNIKVQ